MGADVNFHYQNQQLLPKLTIRQQNQQLLPKLTIRQAYIALSAFGLGLGLGHITRQQRHLVMSSSLYKYKKKKGNVFLVCILAIITVWPEGRRHSPA